MPVEPGKDSPASEAIPVDAQGSPATPDAHFDLDRLDIDGECRLDLDAELASLQRIEIVTESLCAQIGLDSLRTFAVVLSISEAMSNVVRHAGRSASSSPIHIHYQKLGGTLRVCLSDAGEPMPATVVARYREPAPNQPGRTAASGSAATPTLSSVEQLPDGGWGVNLILQGARAISYRRAAGRNHLTLNFDLNV